MHNLTNVRRTPEMADESKFQKIDKKNQLFKKQRSQLDMGQEKI
jgi:hypothetical protein